MAERLLFGVQEDGDTRGAVKSFGLVHIRVRSNKCSERERDGQVSCPITWLCKCNEGGDERERRTPSHPASFRVPDEFDTINTLLAPNVRTHEFQESCDTGDKTLTGQREATVGASSGERAVGDSPEDGAGGCRREVSSAREKVARRGQLACRGRARGDLVRTMQLSLSKTTPR